jgi:hypothetical protein
LSPVTKTAASGSSQRRVAQVVLEERRSNRSRNSAPVFASKASAPILSPSPRDQPPCAHGPITRRFDDDGLCCSMAR